MDTKEPSLIESIDKVMAVLPLPVRSYLQNLRYIPVIQDLSSKYGLRTDQSGVLERKIIVLIMGIDAPEEFLQALTETSITEDTARKILADINTQVFVPLREEMRKQSQQGSVSAPVAAPAAAAPQNRTAPPAPSKPEVMTYSRPVTPPLPPPTPSRPSYASVPSLIPQVKKPSINILRQDPPLGGETPKLPPASQIYRPQGAAPTTSAPRSVQPQSPRPNLAPVPPRPLLPSARDSQRSPAPNAIQHPPLVPPARRQTHPSPPAPPQPPKNYGTDPYREPIE
jgi:hypothetical protein